MITESVIRPGWIIPLSRTDPTLTHTGTTRAYREGVLGDVILVTGRVAAARVAETTYRLRPAQRTNGPPLPVGAGAAAADGAESAPTEAARRPINARQYSHCRGRAFSMWWSIFSPYVPVTR